MKLTYTIALIAVVQLIWLYKAFRAGGFLSVINLICFASLNALAVLISQDLNALQN